MASKENKLRAVDPRGGGENPLPGEDLGKKKEGGDRRNEGIHRASSSSAKKKQRGIYASERKDYRNP